MPAAGKERRDNGGETAVLVQSQRPLDAGGAFAPQFCSQSFLGGAFLFVVASCRRHSHDLETTGYTRRLRHDRIQRRRAPQRLLCT
jgi:hypothetical protein